jgi:predicted PhzF superfamily epimerase YddE/YHI9
LISCGINEDPVTGSAHCTLAPYWKQRFGINEEMTAYQASSRGGYLQLKFEDDDRVVLGGKCITTITSILLC